MAVSEKVAYLKGLMEGLDIDSDKKEGKMFAAIIDVLDEIAEELDCVNDDIAELQDYIEEIDEDLGDVEEFVYECFDDDDDCCCGDDCCCDDEDCIEVTCPACEETVCIGLDEIDDNAEAECPCCGAVLEFEIEEEDEE
ncbi:MAG: hypothetical protein IKY78_06575 [Clostridia bacterium]|nr:hypothetical protein [Clostridia bacterium]